MVEQNFGPMMFNVLIHVDCGTEYTFSKFAESKKLGIAADAPNCRKKLLTEVMEYSSIEMFKT